MYFSASAAFFFAEFSVDVSKPVCVVIIATIGVDFSQSHLRETDLFGKILQILVGPVAQSVRAGDS